MKNIVLKVNKDEYGVIVNSLNEYRKVLKDEKKSTDEINHLLLKLLDIPTEKTIFGRVKNDK